MADAVDVTGRPTTLRPVDLDRFFRPKRIAVIGASDTERRPHTAMWRKLRTWAEANGAEAIPVNPSRDEVDGVRCYHTIFDVPGDIDLAAIVVGDVLPAARDVIERKVAFAVIFAAGFNEVGGDGEKLQAELEALIRTGDTRFVGPNTNLNAFELYDPDRPGRRLALITQSGHQGRPIYQAHEDLHVAMSHWAPLGNEADLEFADFAAYFADQPDVGVVAAYIEGFKDGRTLMLAADHAAQRKVPIVAIKVGRTDEGRSMAKAHTGHLTGADDVVSAVFRQFGVTRVDGLDELLDTATMFARTAPPSGDGVCVYAISGGTGAHMADLAAAGGLRLPTLTKQTQDALRQWIPSYLRVSNPVDNGGGPSGDERGRKILDAIVADPNVDLVICPITGALPTMAKRLTQDLVDVSRTTDKPICVIWGSPTYDSAEYRDTLRPAGIPVFHSFGNCVRAVRAYFDWHAFAARYKSPFARPVITESKAGTPARDVLASAGRTLTEHESKQILAAYGIPVTEERLCMSRKEAVKAAEHIGYPVVLKASSATILHKSDRGLVRVGVRNEKQVRAAFDELAATKGVDGVLVCEQVEGGVETVVGVAQDELFGPTIMFGIGGVFLEVLRDVTFRVPPFDKTEARRMIDEVQGAAFLRGARGGDKASIPALVDVIMKVQRLAVDLHDEV
ncbi:MAG: acetate--CoA ligase family protein, partial [Actinobacteria bacterium]|nr:acetate--CoA ligase family protein [Actinomycetota bacterium]